MGNPATSYLTPTVFATRETFDNLIYEEMRRAGTDNVISAGGALIYAFTEAPKDFEAFLDLESGQLGAGNADLYLEIDSLQRSELHFTLLNGAKTLEVAEEDATLEHCGSSSLEETRLPVETDLYACIKTHGGRISLANISYYSVFSDYVVVRLSYVTLR